MGLVSLHSAVVNKLDFLHVVFDNHSVAMTGHQISPTTFKEVDVAKLLESIGVDELFEADAFKPWEVNYKLKKAQEAKGVKVLWIRGECAFFPSEKRLERQKCSPFIMPEKCGDCDECYQELACPSIKKNDKEEFFIDLETCFRCGVCFEVCQRDALGATYE